MTTEAIDTLTRQLLAEARHSQDPVRCKAHGEDLNTAVYIAAGMARAANKFRKAAGLPALTYDDVMSH